MTLDTSLEINRKLQAVFEDALLKNITLKVIGLFHSNGIFVEIIAKSRNNGQWNSEIVKGKSWIKTWKIQLISNSIQQKCRS